MKAPSHYFIQPGDQDIKAELTLSLDELKGLHYCQLKLHKANDQEGFISKPNTDMLSKLESVIEYLQKQHYPHA